MEIERQRALKAQLPPKMVRRLLVEALDDVGLTTLCHDDFPNAHKQFTDGMTRLAKIQIVIEYCYRHGAVDKLLELIKYVNPNKYHAVIEAPQEQIITTFVKLDNATKIDFTVSETGAFEIKVSGQYTESTPESIQKALEAIVLPTISNATQHYSQTWPSS